MDDRALKGIFLPLGPTLANRSDVPMAAILNGTIRSCLAKQTPVVLGVSATHDPDHPYADRRAITTPVAQYNGDPRPSAELFAPRATLAPAA